MIVDVFGKNERAGLLIGMLIGDTSLLSKKRVNVMTDAGLVNILAVSG
jgi:predicted membrane metal-binding protein